ncbi:hypothetical protein THMIRHAM_03060 [Thiomicrorhabdus immobilis]|uniref:DUF3955 domain-containing protein n=1 Tax=Thiomicrorhabdus immobilis TaxID=2791037 RepID=A0ABN6CU83_9GAMM|nr:hypothetical protein [Thiomicrorhabdus immobilis]BCN92521.1 hypothetical protein THMIRHAM_03060 [Thiomicrorhabdus immobilis]
MCIFILAIMAILLFYLSGSIEQYQLNELIDGINIPVSQGWEVLYSLWPAMGFMFFSGIFTVLIIMKFWKQTEASQEK